VSDSFLEILPKYIIDFPEVDTGDLGDTRPPTEEEEKEDRARRKEEKEKAVEEVAWNAKLMNFIDTLATIQEYYGKLLHFLNIQSLMAEVAECYMEGFDAVEIARAWCRANLKLSIETLPDVVGYFYVEAIASSTDMTDEQKKEALEEFQDTYGDDAREIINLVRAVVKGIGEWPTTTQEGPITGYVSNEFVGKPLTFSEDLSSEVDYEAGQEANEAWQRGQPLLGGAKEGQKEAKEVAKNFRKVDKWIDQVDKWLNFADFCEKIAKQIPSISSLASVQNVNGRPGSIGSLNEFADFPEDFRKRFTPPEPPVMEFSSDFNVGDLLAFIGQQVQVALEKAALASLQAVCQGLMKDWLDACKRGKAEAAQGDVDAQAAAQEALIGPASTGTITGALSSALGPALADLITLDLIYMLIDGLTKDEICSLFMGNPTDLILKLLEMRVKKNNPELYFAGLNRVRIKTVFEETGKVIDLGFCADDEEYPEDVRFCLDPTVEHAEKQWMEENGIDPSTAKQILDMRRAERTEKLTNLLKGMMTETLLPQKVEMPPVSVDEPYLKEIISGHARATYASIYDSLIGDLKRFSGLNLELSPEQSTPDVLNSQGNLPDGYTNAGEDNFTKLNVGLFGALQAVNTSLEDRNVNSPILDLILNDHYSDGVTDGMFSSPEELAEEGASFALADARYVVEVATEDDVTLFQVRESGEDDVIFESEVVSNFDIERMLLESNLETKLTSPLQLDGTPQEMAADGFVMANIKNLFYEVLSTYVKTNISPDYPLDLLDNMLRPLDRVGSALLVQGRRILEDLFRGQMLRSKLFKAKNFQNLRFVNEDVCVPIFEHTALLPIDAVEEAILKDYQSLLSADLGNFKIVNAVMLTSLVHTLVEIYVYEFLLAFVFFGDKLENNFYASDAIVEVIARLTMTDLTRVFDTPEKRNDLYNIILNIPFIQQKEFDNSLKYDAESDSKPHKAQQIMRALVAKVVTKGNVFTGFKKIFEATDEATDMMSQFQAGSEIDDLQALVTAFVGRQTEGNDSLDEDPTMWYGDIRNTKTHAATAIDKHFSDAKKDGTYNEELRLFTGEYLLQHEFREVFTANREVLTEARAETPQFILEPYIKIPTSLEVPDEIRTLIPGYLPTQTDTRDVTFSLLDFQFILDPARANPYVEVYPLFRYFTGIDLESDKKDWKLGLRLTMVDDDKTGGIIEEFTTSFVDDPTSEHTKKAGEQMAEDLFVTKKVLSQRSEFLHKDDWTGVAETEEGFPVIDKAFMTEVFTTIPLLKEEVAVSPKEVMQQFKDYFAWEHWMGGWAAPGPGPETIVTIEGTTTHVTQGTRGSTEMPVEVRPYYDTTYPKDPTKVNPVWGEREDWQGRDTTAIGGSIGTPPTPSLLDTRLQSLLTEDDYRYRVRIGRVFRSALVNLRKKMFSYDNQGFNLLVRFLFSGSDLITAYRLFFTFNNDDERYFEFGSHRSALAKTKKDITDKMNILLYGGVLNTISVEAEQAETDNFKNTNAAIAELAAKTVPMIMKGILDKYDPGYMVLNQLKKMDEAEEDDTVLTYNEDFPYLCFITTPFGILYAAGEKLLEKEPQPTCEDQAEATDQNEEESVPTMTEPVETQEDIEGAGLTGQAPPSGGDRY